MSLSNSCGTCNFYKLYIILYHTSIRQNHYTVHIHVYTVVYVTVGGKTNKTKSWQQEAGKKSPNVYNSGDSVQFALVSV